MIDTAGTLVNAAHAHQGRAPASVAACATHAVLSGPAIEKIKESALSKVLVTNSIPLSEEKRRCEKIVVLPIAELMAKAIRNIHEEASVTSLFV